MFARLLLILVIAAVVYVVLAKLMNRAGPSLGQAARDPRMRAAATGIGLLALRALLQRFAPGIGRWLSVMRWFR